jgi:hypothetical protein
LAVGRLTWTSLYVASVVVLFILAGEILKTIADRDADAAASSPPRWSEPQWRRGWSDSPRPPTRSSCCPRR